MAVCESYQDENYAEDLCATSKTRPILPHSSDDGLGCSNDTFSDDDETEKCESLTDVGGFERQLSPSHRDDQSSKELYRETDIDPDEYASNILPYICKACKEPAKDSCHAQEEQCVECQW